MSIKGKVAIVTGSARGIGKVTVMKMASAGAKVVVTDMNYESCLEVKDEIIKNGGEAIAVKCNVTSREDVQNLMKETVETFGKLDVVVNNAGITKDATFLKMTDEQWDAVIDVNLKGSFITCQEAAKVLLPNKSGSIINISSVAADLGNFGQANYAAAKAGILGLTKTMSIELGRKGITCNSVSPGFIETEMTAVIPEKVKEQLIAKATVARVGQPNEVAAAIIYLASDEAGFVNGHNLRVNGGWYV